MQYGWTAPTEEMPNFWRFYEPPVELAEVARDIVVAFIAAYGATPQSQLSYSPALPQQDLGDDVPAPPALQVLDGTGPLERAARTHRCRPSCGWRTTPSWPLPHRTRCT